MVGVDAKQGLGCLMHKKVLEPLSGKVTLLYHVIQCLQQLLRVDTLVSVTKLPDRVTGDVAPS